MRLIGIRHRVKQTARQEARPTMVAIKEDDALRTLELETETDELDFLLGRFPLGYRFAGPDEDLSKLRPHHLKSRKKSGEKEESPMVPTAYDGLAPSDTVLMMLGGSGDRLAYALSRRGEEIGASVFRIPPFNMVRSEGAKKDKDQESLITLYQENPSAFYAVGPRDRDLIATAEAYRGRKDAQKARIACDQRLRQHAIGRVFISLDGKYPEGTIEDYYDKLKASDTIFLNLVREEAAREKELKQAVAKLDVWQHILKGVVGCGEVLAAGIITPIGDIRRFANDAKLKKFAGVHVQSDGKFARKRTGSVANWNPQLRQALYNLGDQFVKRDESHWGLKYREYKVKFRAAHPEVIVVQTPDGPKKRYSDGHIHKMAYWRTITKFVEWFHKEWVKLEAEIAK